MKLFELFDNKSPFQVAKQSDNEFAAFAVINGRMIQFDADLDSDGAWVVFFKETRGGKNNYNLTGGGGEFEVFAMVKAVMEKFFDLYQPLEVWFTASKSEGTRAQLYSKLMARYKPVGYTLSSDAGDTNQRFVLRKETNE